MRRRRVWLCAGQPPNGCEAMIQGVRGGYRLLLASAERSPWELRRRFLVAHEILETFFFCEETEIPTHWSKLIDYRQFATRRALGATGGEEALCDYGAGLLLVPSSEVAALTKLGERLPDYRSFREACKRWRVSELAMTHRMANYLAVQHGTEDDYAVVALARKVAHESQGANGQAEWRLVPAVRRGLPVGTDVRARMQHAFYLPTNKTIGSLGLGQLVLWLESKESGDAPPFDVEGCLSCNGKRFKVRLRAARRDRDEPTAILWLTLRVED